MADENCWLNKLFSTNDGIRRGDSYYTTETEGLHAQISRLISRR